MTTLAQDPVRSQTTVCAACGQVHYREALFCRRCTAPLSVVSLGDLTPQDRQTCLSSLFQVLADTLREEPPAAPAEHDETLWRSYLSAFWLRPETALILFAEALAIQSTGATGPWLDLGCGDGIHAALYSGWRFDGRFDAFQSLDLSAADIYHHWDGNEFEAKHAARGPRIDFGIDIKSTAVQRAQALDVFSLVERTDATKLPLPDRSVRTIFSNMLRDLGDPLPQALAECRRVLTDDGTLLISAMTPAYAKNLHFAPQARQAEMDGDSSRARAFLRLDRGRSVFCQRQLAIADWQSLLNQQGLKVTSVRPIVGPSIIRFWDIGLRPFSISLLRQRQTWKDSGTLAAMKIAMMEILVTTLQPLLGQLTAGEPCMNLLSVSKA